MKERLMAKFDKARADFRFKLAAAAALQLDDDDAARLVRALNVGRMGKVAHALVDPEEFGARGHFDHASWMTNFFEKLRNAFDEEYCEDVRITPELWDEMKPHAKYVKCILDLLMTEDELMWAYGSGDVNPFEANE